MTNFNNLNKLWKTAEKETMSVGEALLVFIVMIIVILGVLAISWWIAMLLWNAIMPIIFGLPTITFWQMAGLNILLSLIIPHSSQHTSKE